MNIDIYIENDGKKIMEKRKNYSKSFRYLFAKQFKWKCQLCENKVSFDPFKYGGFEAHVDHIIPLNQGGTNDIENLTLLCHKCNTWKTDKWLPHIAKYLEERTKNVIH